MTDEMEMEGGTPWHLWVVGILSLIWNGIGANDYVMTQTQNEAYLEMGGFTDAQLDFFYSMPPWVDAFWALGVWAAVLGSVLLLFRSRWAVWAFVLSVVGLIGTTVQNFFLSGVDVNALFGMGYLAFTVVIWVVTLFLLWYSSRMRARGVLR